VVTAKTEGSKCFDGNKCTVNSICTAGVCSNGMPKNCSTSNLCVTRKCNPATGKPHAF
jgi:hypothetical protein